MQAAILRVKLRYLNKWNLRRQEIARLYYNGLRANRNIHIVDEDDSRKSVYHIFPIEVNHREVLRENLKKSGIETLIHYPLPLHLQEVYRELTYKKGDFPVTENIADRILSIPIYPELTEPQIEYIIKKLNELV
jgi:dTDP-4-amino-4,6-dideoxygalactose transaminase